MTDNTEHTQPKEKFTRTPFQGDSDDIQFAFDLIAVLPPKVTYQSNEQMLLSLINKENLSNEYTAHQYSRKIINILNKCVEFMDESKNLNKNSFVLFKEYFLKINHQELLLRHTSNVINNFLDRKMQQIILKREADASDK